MVAARGVDLGLGEEQRAGQVGAAQIGVAEIRSDQVGLAEIRVPEVRADQVGAAEVGLLQIGFAEACPDEVGAAALLLLGSASRGRDGWSSAATR